MSGWIKLHRKIHESARYFSEPFCRNMAWVDLLLLANHDDNFFRCHGIRVDVKRGQCGQSMPNLAKRWKWSKGKVKRFLDELVGDSQIVLQKTNVTTLITILNYESYQGDDTANGTAKKPANRTASDTANGPQTDPNKNVKNEKEVRGASAPSYKQWTEKQFYDEIAKFASQYPKDLLRKFYDYWREPSPSGMMAFQLKKTWSTSLRLKNWQNRESNPPAARKAAKDESTGAPPLKVLQ